MFWSKKKKEETPEPMANKTILDRIAEDKRAEVEAFKRTVTYESLRDQALKCEPVRDFKGAISRRGRINVIAEIKKASPSKGVLREDFDPVAIAKDYAANGASALSVLTDEKYFQGRLEYVKQVKAVVDVPILRKDFIIDPIQLPQSRLAGADAVLFIAALWPDYRTLRELVAAADECGLHWFVEVHSREELEFAYAVGAGIVGVNNRNLKTFEVDLNTTAQVSRFLVEECTLISESGIKTPEDIKRLKSLGVHAILVGEHFMKSPSPGEALKALMEEQ